MIPKKFSESSVIHLAEKSNNNLTIKPIKDDLISLKNFQSIAEEACGLYSNEYLIKEHTVNGLIDMVVFISRK